MYRNNPSRYFFHIYSFCSFKFLPPLSFQVILHNILTLTAFTARSFYATPVYLLTFPVKLWIALSFRVSGQRFPSCATILMVTHDAYSASYANRVLFLKDGRVFNELLRGKRGRSVFYHEILDVLAALGGDISDVI